MVYLAFGYFWIVCSLGNGLPCFLMVIHFYDAPPIICNLNRIESFTDVDLKKITTNIDQLDRQVWVEQGKAGGQSPKAQGSNNGGRPGVAKSPVWVQNKIERGAKV